MTKDEAIAKLNRSFISTAEDFVDALEALGVVKFEQEITQKMLDAGVAAAFCSMNRRGAADPEFWVSRIFEAMLAVRSSND